MDKPIVCMEDVFAYCGIDYLDEATERNITRYMHTAERFIAGSIGDKFPRDDPRVQDIALMIINDLYENRGILAATTSGNARKLLNDFSLQLRLEMRRAKNEQTV